MTETVPVTEEERFGMLRGVLGSGSLPERCVIGLAACAGTSAGPATLSLGAELAADGKHVVVADLGDLQHVTHDEAAAFDPDALLCEPDGLYHWRPDAASFHLNRGRSLSPGSSDARIWLVELLRSSFDVTLLEAPALDTGLKPVLLSALCDAMVLVVEAGKCRVSQIEWARKTLELANANLIGSVLTGRKYPVPGWIHKRL